MGADVLVPYVTRSSATKVWILQDIVFVKLTRKMPTMRRQVTAPIFDCEELFQKGIIWNGKKLTPHGTRTHDILITCPVL